MVQMVARVDKKKIKRPNPVAKYGRKFNRAKVFRDKTKYDRKNRRDDDNCI